MKHTDKQHTLFSDLAFIAIIVMLLISALLTFAADHSSYSESVIGIFYMSLLCFGLIALMYISCLRSEGERDLQEALMLLMTITAFLLFLDMIAWAVQKRADCVQLLLMLSSLKYIVATFLVWYFARFLQIWSNVRDAHATMILQSAGLLNFALTFANAFVGFFFTVSAEGVLLRSDIFLLSYVPCILMLLGIFRLILQITDSFSKRAILLSYPLIPLICGILTSHQTGPSLLWIAAFFSLFFIYSNLYVRRMEAMREKDAQLARMDAELAESQKQLLISQIQPHFLFNVLATISHLCKKDAALAKTAIDSFADYMRMNLDSIQSGKLIAFSQELKHVQTYLWLEKLRFGEDLRIEYQIEFSDFRVPPLSVQPLVENAVKHGICKKEDGGTVRIISQRDETGFRIEICDDGAGFDPTVLQNDGRTHIGINNVRDRLSSLCGGSLEIRSAPGIGTTAEIRIPNALQEEAR